MTTLWTPPEALSYSNLLLHLAMDRAQCHSWKARVEAMATLIAARETYLAMLDCHQEALRLHKEAGTLERHQSQDLSNETSDYVVRTTATPDS